MVSWFFSANDFQIKKIFPLFVESRKRIAAAAAAVVENFIGTLSSQEDRENGQENRLANEQTDLAKEPGDFWLKEFEKRIWD